MRIGWRVLAVTAAAWTLAAASGWFVASWATYADNRDGNPRYHPACIKGDEGTANGPVCWTDNATLTYYMDSNGAYELEAPDRAFVTWVMTNRFNPTDLTVSYDSTPSLSGSAETDVVYQEGAVESGFQGVTWCDDPQDSTLYGCDQQYIRIRGNGVYQRAIVCHETGHAVGLTHGENADPQVPNSDADLGCMRDPTPNATWGTWATAFINSMY